MPAESYPYFLKLFERPFKRRSQNQRRGEGCLRCGRVIPAFTHDGDIVHTRVRRGRRNNAADAVETFESGGPVHSFQTYYTFGGGEVAEWREEPKAN